MLKLIYDVRCGFKELYMTEKNCEFDLTPQLEVMHNHLSTPLAEIESSIFEDYKSNPQALLDDLCDGVEECIYEATVEEFGHTYFKDICFKDKDRPYLPGFFKMYNLRLVKETAITLDMVDDGSKENILDSFYKIKAKMEGSLRAEDVMAILGISRQTLSNWVKRGLIEAKKTATGRYVYDADSVYKLKEGK